MARIKRTIRASEISSFVYCQRAWWYQRQNLAPINLKEMAAGQDFHQRHTNQTRSANIVKFLAWVLAAAAVVITAALIAGLPG